MSSEYTPVSRTGVIGKRTAINAQPTAKKMAEAKREEASLYYKGPDGTFKTDINKK